MSVQIEQGAILREQVRKADRVISDAVTKLVEKIEAAVVAGAINSPQFLLRAPLDSVHRFKAGRYRFFYLVSGDLTKIRVIYIGIRCDGDKRDAYVQFEKAIRKGLFDEDFRALGLEPPAF